MKRLLVETAKSLGKGGRQFGVSLVLPNVEYILQCFDFTAQVRQLSLRLLSHRLLFGLVEKYRHAYDPQHFVLQKSRNRLLANNPACHLQGHLCG